MPACPKTSHRCGTSPQPGYNSRRFHVQGFVEPELQWSPEPGYNSRRFHVQGFAEPAIQWYAYPVPRSPILQTRTDFFPQYWFRKFPSNRNRFLSSVLVSKVSLQHQLQRRFHGTDFTKPGFIYSQRHLRFPLLFSFHQNLFPIFPYPDYLDQTFILCTHSFFVPPPIRCTMLYNSTFPFQFSLDPTRR